MMMTRWSVAGTVVAVLVAGCTTAAPPEPEATETTTPATTSTMEVPTPTPTPEPAATPVVGTGVVTVDGTELPVSGDCDISKEFGERPVADLADADVDVVLAVDNLEGSGGHQGDFPIEVRLLGDGEVVGRTVTSVGGVGASGADAPVYEGEVDVARLVDRQPGEFADTATLHLEASQRRREGGGGGVARDLVVDVTCLIARPPG